MSWNTLLFKAVRAFALERLVVKCGRTHVLEHLVVQSGEGLCPDECFNHSIFGEGFCPVFWYHMHVHCCIVALSHRRGVLTVLLSSCMNHYCVGCRCHYC